MIATLKRHLVYKSHKNIYVCVCAATKNDGFCKILIVRYQYIKWEVLMFYTFLRNQNKIQNHFCYCQKSNMPNHLALTTVIKESYSWTRCRQLVRGWWTGDWHNWRVVWERGRGHKTPITFYPQHYSLWKVSQTAGSQKESQCSGRQVKPSPDPFAARLQANYKACTLTDWCSLHPCKRPSYYSSKYEGTETKSQFSLKSVISKRFFSLNPSLSQPSFLPIMDSFSRYIKIWHSHYATLENGISWSWKNFNLLLKTGIQEFKSKNKSPFKSIFHKYIYLHIKIGYLFIKWLLTR